MKTSDLKNKGVKFELNGIEYELKFDMNTFCKLEEFMAPDEPVQQLTKSVEK